MQLPTKDVQSQNNTDQLMYYKLSTWDAFTERTQRAGNLLHLPGPL
jgi:hypothetical protein